MHGILWKGVIV